MGLSLWLGLTARLPAQLPSADPRVALSASVRAVAPAGTASAVPRAEMVRPALTDTEAAAYGRVEFILKMRHFAELQRRVAAGETIGPAVMSERYLPLAEDYRNVAQWLTAQGLTVATPGPSRAVVTATGTWQQFRQVFQAEFGRVRFRGAEYTAAITTPSLPAGIRALVANVHGLQPYLHPRKPAAAVSSAVGSFQPPYMVTDILDAYNVAGSGLTGAGQAIGIVIDSVPLDSDLTQFWNANGVTQSLANIIIVNVASQKLPAPSGEETLDVSWSSGLAPGAQIVVYACGDLSDVDACYSQILDDLQNGSRPNLHQISMSFGAGEETDETDDDISSTNQMFTAMAAYGVSLFAASGDGGAYGDGDHQIQVLYPASDPNVTGVGGTSLVLNPDTGAVASEDAWSGASSGHGGGGGAASGSSGGGVSSYFSRPVWQVGSTVPAGSMRLVPDVALAANPDDGCYLVFQGKVEQYGGTSWATPSWAGLCALLNQARANAGKTALGGANALLYPLLGTNNFRDITSGNNGAYYAGVGYDEVTGLGVPDFAVLAATLAGATPAPTVLAPAITSALTANTTAGTSFTYQTTASNSPTAFDASGLPAGLSVDATTGLISGTPTVTGTFPVVLSATNSGGTGTGTLSLTVAASLPTVTLTATVPQVALGSLTPGEATLSIPSALSTDLYVYYTVKGSAINGTDYSYLRGVAKIKAGKTGKIIKITPQGDLGSAAKKAVKLILASNTDYIIGTTGFVKITIVQD